MIRHVMTTAVTISGLFCGSIAHADSTDDHRAIEALEDQMAKLPDATVLMSYYAPDALFYDGAAPGVYRGVGEIRAALVKQMTTLKAIKTTFLERSIDISGDLAVATSVQKTSATFKNDSNGLYILRVTDVFRRTPEGWKIIKQHASFPIDSATGRGLWDLMP